MAALEAADGTAGLTWLPADGDPTADGAVVAAALGPLLGAAGGDGLLGAMTAAEHGDASAALAALRDVRLLCAHREGPHGLRRWGELLRARLIAAGAAGGPASPWLTGEPVQVVRNERTGPLRNGDVGIVVGRGATQRLAFDVDDPLAAAPGVPLERPPAAVGPVEGALAVTVHRSQGSEHGTVVVVLPAATSPLATRELLYTAVTRARRHAVVVGDAAAVRACVRTPSVRAGGLADGLATWRRYVTTAPPSPPDAG